MLIGYARVSTTEIYTQFNIRRLEQDFPTLAKEYQMPKYRRSKKMEVTDGN